MTRITPRVVVVGLLMLLWTIFAWTMRAIAFLCLAALYLSLPAAAVVVLLDALRIIHV